MSNLNKGQAQWQLQASLKEMVWSKRADMGEGWVKTFYSWKNFFVSFSLKGGGERGVKDPVPIPTICHFLKYKLHIQLFLGTK